MAEIEFRHVQGLRQNGTLWHGLDVILDGEPLDRSFLTNRELRHIEADPSALRIGIVKRYGRDGFAHKVVQLMLGGLAIGTQLKLSDVEKADVEEVLAEQPVWRMAEDKENR